MTYKNLEQIQKEFNIKSNDLEFIGKKLKSLQKQVSLRKTGDEFTDKGDEELFGRLSEARQFLKLSHKNGQMVHVDAVRDLVRLVTEQRVESATVQRESRVETKIDFAISHYRSPVRRQSFTLSGIAVVMGFLWTMPENAVKFAGPFGTLDSSSPLFSMIWMCLMGGAGLLWLLVSSREAKAKTQLAKLKNLGIQNSLFEGFASQYNRADFTSDKFARFIFNKMNGNFRYGNRPITDFVQAYPRKVMRLLGIVPTELVDMEVATSVAELVIEKGMSKNMLHLSGSAGLSDVYAFDKKQA